MRYYNEAKTERTIQRKAMSVTFIAIFLLVSVVYFTSSESARDVLPEVVKEWIKGETPKEPTKNSSKDKA